ncbi:MAG: hypothetical protein RBU21_12770 [FCB group bacterium]|jgi:hypothetical protein|nr:hypothetical protein [FCB group bacterium]
MKTKVLALLWEETRVGGAIALTALFGGLVTLLMLAANLTSRGGSPGSDPFPLLATLAFPLMTVLLLTLNTANSGHLIGGFSRRILRLPVETWSTVLVILLTRLLTVLLVSGIMVGAAWGLFGEGPGADTILLLGLAYLFIQVLDWLRDAALHIVVPVIALLGLFLLLNLHQLPLLLAPDDGTGWNPALLALAFLPAVVLAYGISVAAVHYARRGAKLDLLAPFSGVALPSLRGHAAAKPFASPLGAHVWYELRRAGLFLPIVTVLFWIAFVGLDWLIVWNSGDSSLRSKPTMMYELVPIFAFLFAAMAWNLRMNRIPSRRKNRPGTYLLRLPVAPIDLARARVIAAFVNFAAVFAVVAVVSRLAFLYIDHGIILWFLREAYANGEISGLEIAGLIIGAPLIVGLVAWNLMHLPGRFIIAETLLAVAFAFYSQTHTDEIFLFLLACVTVFLPIGWFVKVCVEAFRSGRLPAGSLGACLLLWAATGLAIFPYKTTSFADHLWLSIAGCAAVAVLPVFAFVHGLLRLPGHPSAGTLSSRGSAGRRAAGLGLLTATLLMVALVRGTAEPVYKAKMHAEGLPATYDELKALYPPVPKEENLAERYLKSGTTLETLAGRWTSETVARENDPNMAPGAAAMEYASEVILVGDADYNDTEPIPRTIWDRTLDYWDKVGAPVSEELHAAARSGLTQSRYPFNLDDGGYVSLDHLQYVAKLSTHLHLKAIVSAIDGRAEEIATALRDLFPLAESLKDEPFLISQFRRFGTLERVPLALQDALSRKVFTDPELAEFMSILVQNQPRLAEEPLGRRALLGEMLLYMKWSEELMRSGMTDPREVKSLGSLPNSSRVAFSMLTPVAEGLGWNTMERTVNLRTYFLSMEDYRRNRQRGYIEKNDNEDEIWTDHLFTHAPISSIRGGSVWSTRSEWQMAARFDLARAALAVERYRLANGRLPGGLEDLVPQYLERVPLDPYRENAPLSYRSGENGGYTVYSFGSDWEDDGGEFIKPSQDICFNVPSLELRTRPQVQ